MQNVILLMGQIASGKSSAGEYIRHMYGAYVLHMSDLVRNMIQFVEGKVTRPLIEETLSYLHERFQQTYLSDCAMTAMRSYSGPIIVLDGVRLRVDLDSLHSHYPRLTTIAVQTKDAFRYQRFFSRAAEERDMGMSFQDFIHLSQHPFEREVPDLLKQADYHVSNNDVIEDFYRRIDDVMRDILSRSKFLV